jgi:hypothetical protein
MKILTISTNAECCVTIREEVFRLSDLSADSREVFRIDPAWLPFK